MSTPQPSVLPEPLGSASDVPFTHPDSSIFTSNGVHAAVGHQTKSTNTSSCLQYTMHAIKISLSSIQILSIAGPKELFLTEAGEM